MALALYRKYRPATFAEVIGQEHVTQPLSQAVDGRRINHAYLFSGPRGCGKTSSARILARSVNCERGPSATPCGECPSCIALAPDGPGSLDVIEIDAASHGGVDDARDLRERAFFAPVSSRYKIYIVDEAHMVSAQGFNALLKLVEEPPEFLLFIFATTEPEKVLPTIRSRTHHYPFRLIPPGVLRAHLEMICSVEGVPVERAVYPLIVRAGGGSARDSLSLLDQLLAGAGPEGVTYQRAVALLGVTDAALLDEMVDSLAASDGGAMLQTVDRVVEAGHDPRRFAIDLLERLRDLIVMDAIPDAAAKGLIDAPADQLERMTEQAQRLGRATLSRCADIIHSGLIEMRGTTSPRLLLELLCARMVLPAVSSDSAAVLQRMERLERRGAIISTSQQPDSDQTQHSVSPAPHVGARNGEKERLSERKDSAETSTSAHLSIVRSSAEKTQPPTERTPASDVDSSAPAVAATPATSPPHQTSLRTDGSPQESERFDAAVIRRIWPDVMEAVKKRRRATHAMLMNASVSNMDGDVLVITATSQPLARLISEQENVDNLRGALQEVIGIECRIRCVTEPTRPDVETEEQQLLRAAARPSAGDTTTPEVESSEDEPPAVSEKRSPEEAAVSLLETTLGARRLKSSRE